MKQKMPWKRLLNYLGIVIASILLTVFFAYQAGFLLDEALSYLVLDAVFLAVLLYMLENARLRGEIGNSETDQYGKIAVFYAIFCVVAGVFSFLPAFTCPAAAFALFLSIVSTTEIAAGLSIFLSTLLCAASGGSFYELAACVVLALVGAGMAKTMHQKRDRIWGCMILLSVTICIPTVFYYLAYGEYWRRLLLWNGEFGVFFLIVYYLAADGLYDRADHGDAYAFESIMHENYPLVTAIRNYSKTEYIHALKVAALARKCAEEIHADAAAAAAAGFYYRLGILEGEPVVENAVRLAEESCFPDAVIKILSEYNGQERLPSSRESAIVHMVDLCVKREETQQVQDSSSSWNQDMAIYQLLNEVSATGIYDESGLSMNQFLKIRELLIREEIGYDSNY